MAKHTISLTSLLMLLLIVSSMSFIRPLTEAKQTILTAGLTNPNDVSTVQTATIVVDSEDNKLIAHELRIKITGCGGISPDEGTHTYENGTKVSVSASESFSAYGTFFSYWLVDGAQTTSNNPLLLIMDKDHDLMAVFKGSPHVYNTPETTETKPLPPPSPITKPASTPTPTPSPITSPSPSPSPKPLSSQETFQAMTGAITSGISAAIIGIGLMVYFKKHKR